MDIAHLLAGHVFLVAVLIILFSSIGIPLPATVSLLALGAAAHAGSVPLLPALAAVWAAALLGDSLLYFGGRSTGWWLLSRLCRVSTNPEQCIFRSSGYFYRRGPRTLLFAKFIPGLGVMAAPLAGSLNMRPTRFLRLDAVGALVWTAGWTLTGYLFYRSIDAIERGIAQLGHVVLTGIAALVVIYAAGQLASFVRSRRFRQIERVDPAALQSHLTTLPPDKLVVIADVRSHGYYDPGMQRIKNSIRVEPHRLQEELVALREFMAPECEIYLYCSCIKEATSVRVAYLMNQQNCQTKVIAGGLRAWQKAGGEVEPVPPHELEHLPRFD